MNESKRISVIGVASDVGGLYRGASQAPAVLRTRGLPDSLSQLGYLAGDSGDIIAVEVDSEGGQEIVNHLQVVQVARNLYDRMLEVLANDTFPLIIGGDHSISTGSVAAFSDHCRSRGQRPGLLWVDTHADINTPQTSPSACAFGMPVAALLGIFPDTLSRISSNPPALLAEQIVYVGLRDVDQGERRLIRDMRIQAYTMKEIDAVGLAAVVEKAVAHLRQHCDCVILSFDLDVCDPQIVPGTGTPKRGGLTFRESHLLMELLWDSNILGAAEIVELNPVLDKDFETADLTISLIESLLGKSIL
ncbi:MAG: arginase [bacterium]|nr:arginase [bacterium]